jgi:hypothetical protein
MDPFLIMYGTQSSREAERRRLDLEIERRRVIRERAEVAAAAARPVVRRVTARRGILSLLRLHQA